MTKLRQFEAAIADYNQAININPQHEGGYYNRGNAKTMLRQFEAAILDYDQAITINPQLAHAYCGRGNAKYYLRQFETAISDYCLAIPLSLNLLSTQNHNVKATHLLKFREINARNVDSIRNRQVWFAHPNTFSDKTDGKYLIELFPENNSIQQIVSSILVYSCFGI